MITILDTNKRKFYLLKTAARDEYFFAKKTDIQFAIQNGNCFKLYKRSGKRFINGNIARIFPAKYHLTIELGCHQFRGRARQQLVKWLKS
jgi:hypothetical protein